MPARIPFKTSINNYRLSISITNDVFLFDVRWNAFDEAWYFDLRQEDETLILGGIKIVLGMSIGRTCNHAFFKSNILQVIDTTDSKLDAGYDDLGARIQMVLTSSTEVRT